MKIVVEDVDRAEELWGWLLGESDLQGHLRRDRRLTADAMGPGLEIVLASAALAGALTRSLTVWLAQQRSDITIDLVRADGRKLSMSARRVPDAEVLLGLVLSDDAAALEKAGGDDERADAST